MTELKYTPKFTTATSITPTLQPVEVIFPAVQVTPLDGKVYRLLRPEENANDGISAKHKFSNVTAAYHVAWGSSPQRYPSKYISTCRYLGDVKSISSKNQLFNGDIVSINVDNAPVTVLHVWDAEVRKQLIREEQVVDLETIIKFNTFAEYNNEVLLVGNVPANCVTIEISKNFLPNCFGQTA